MSNTGRPQKLTDPDVLQTLMEVKLEDQLSWDELAEWYEQTYGESIHPHTIRRSLLRDAPMLLVPDRVSKKVKEAVETVWDKVDLLQLILFTVNARFTEWTLLYEKMMKATVDSDQKFSQSEQERMDKLWEDLIRFFMNFMTILRDLKTANAAIPELEVMVRARSTEVGQSEGSSAEGLTADSLGKLIQEVGEQTRNMLQGVHEKHREEGRGFYRALPETEEDLLEVDE